MMNFVEIASMCVVVFILMAVGVFAYEGFKTLLMDCYHRWLPWATPDSEGAQIRTCRKCNLTQKRNIK